jgi:CheY-like chemotaxis protein
MSRKIALVGHCGPDSYMLRSAVKYAVKDSEVLMITDDNALSAALSNGVGLLLVNRVLDGNFELHEGVELVRRLKSSYPDTPTMLISNYADSQKAAEEAGARPGFGKGEIGTDKMKTALAGVFG